MTKIYYFQTSPDIIFDEDGKLIKEFEEGFTEYAGCNYINNCFDLDDIFIVNNSYIKFCIQKRCKNQVMLKEFDNKFQVKPKEKKVRQSHKHKTLEGDYVFKFGKYAGKQVIEADEQYIKWFKNNVPKSKW